MGYLLAYTLPFGISISSVNSTSPQFLTRSDTIASVAATVERGEFSEFNTFLIEIFDPEALEVSRSPNGALLCAMRNEHR